jgi:hypothetical protein
MTGHQIVTLKKCGTSNTCQKIQAKHKAIIKLLSQNNSKLNLIKTAIDSNKNSNVENINVKMTKNNN